MGNSMCTKMMTANPGLYDPAKECLHVLVWEMYAIKERILQWQ